MFGTTHVMPISLLFFVACALLNCVDAAVDVEAVLEEVYKLKEQNGVPSQDLMDRVFQAVDQNDKGYLVKEDLKTFVLDHMLPFLAKKVRASGLTDEQEKALQEAMDKSKAELGDDQKLAVLFGQMDANQDGKVDHKEFVDRLMERVQAVNGGGK